MLLACMMLASLGSICSSSCRGSCSNSSSVAATSSMCLCRRLRSRMCAAAAAAKLCRAGGVETCCSFCGAEHASNAGWPSVVWSLCLVVSADRRSLTLSDPPAACGITLQLCGSRRYQTHPVAAPRHCLVVWLFSSLLCLQCTRASCCTWLALVSRRRFGGCCSVCLQRSSLLPPSLLVSAAAGRLVCLGGLLTGLVLVVLLLFVVLPLCPPAATATRVCNASVHPSARQLLLVVVGSCCGLLRPRPLPPPGQVKLLLVLDG